MILPIFAHVMRNYESARTAYEDTLEKLREQGRLREFDVRSLIICTNDEKHIFVVGTSDHRHRYAGYQFRGIIFQEGKEFSGDVINYLISRVRYVE